MHSRRSSVVPLCVVGTAGWTGPLSPLVASVAPVHDSRTVCLPPQRAASFSLRSPIRCSSLVHACFGWEVQVPSDAKSYDLGAAHGPERGSPDFVVCGEMEFPQGCGANPLQDPSSGAGSAAVNYVPYYYQYGGGPSPQQQPPTNQPFSGGAQPSAPQQPGLYQTSQGAPPQTTAVPVMGNPGGFAPATSTAPTAPAAAPASASYFDYTAPQTEQELRVNRGANQWATGMWNAPCTEPGMCLCAFVCPCCCTFLQRRRLLMNDWNNYRCCADTCRLGRSCPCLKNQGCGPCAPCCLALETVFCLGCAVFANRYMVKKHYKLKDECCDSAIIWSACLCRCVARCVHDSNVNRLADCWYAVVLSCILAQGEHQMNTFSYPTSASMK